MSKTDCVNCKYFHGYDGVGELWVGCALHGDFKVQAVNCKSFEKKVTKADMVNKIHSLEREVERQRNEIKLLREQISKFPPNIREVWLE